MRGFVPGWVVALGLAAGQLLSGDLVAGVPLRRTLAGVLALVGGLLVLVGWYRYRLNRSAIDRVAFRPASTSVTLATVSALIALVLALVFIWLLARAS